MQPGGVTRKLSNRRAGALFGIAFAASSLAAVWANTGPATHVQASPCTTFSKYGGTVPCDGGYPVPKNVQDATTQIIIGCGLALLTGPEGAPIACGGVIAGQVGSFL